jgi:multiple sugar transport system permease protein
MRYARGSSLRRSGAERKIALPLMRIPLIVVGALSFVLAYGQLVYPLTLLTQQELQPATVGIHGLVGAQYANWHRATAFSSVFVLPILVARAGAGDCDRHALDGA